MYGKPFHFILNVYLSSFLFPLFSGIQLWGSHYALLKAMKGSFTAQYGLHTSQVVLHLPQVSMMGKRFSQQKTKIHLLYQWISSALCPADGSVCHIHLFYKSEQGKINVLLQLDLQVLLQSVDHSLGHLNEDQQFSSCDLVAIFFCYFMQLSSIHFTLVIDH